MVHLVSGYIIGLHIVLKKQLFKNSKFKIYWLNVFFETIWLQLRTFIHECNTTSFDCPFDMSSGLTLNVYKLT